MPLTTVCVFGLGEAGYELARDLAGAGVTVKAFDPAERPTPRGVLRADSPKEAIAGVEAVLSLTAGADSSVALTQGLPTSARMSCSPTVPPRILPSSASSAGSQRTVAIAVQDVRCSDFIASRACGATMWCPRRTQH